MLAAGGYWQSPRIPGELPSYNAVERVALFEPVLAAVLRVAAHPAVYRPPTPRPTIEAFIDGCLCAGGAVALRADTGHWTRFRELCARAVCRGNLVQDAYLAALALEHDCILVTTDRDFARFPGLQWRHPLDDTRVTENPR